MTITNEELQKHLNSSLQQTLDALRVEGYLTMEQYNDVVLNYSVIVEDTSWLPSWLARYIGLKDSHVSFSLVKVIGRTKHEGV